MSGTSKGAIQGVETIKARHGADFFKKIGAMGGKNGKTGGFYGNPELASKAGKLAAGVKKRKREVSI